MDMVQKFVALGLLWLLLGPLEFWTIESNELVITVVLVVYDNMEDFSWLFFSTSYTFF